MITPRAKKENYSGEKIAISKKLTVSVKNELEEKVFAAIEIFFKSTGITFVPVKDKADITLEVNEALSDKLERYSVLTDKNGIKLSFADFLGGRNALATLYQLIRCEGDEVYVLEAEIDDWADNKMRGVLLDPARRFIPIKDLKNTFVRMALGKMNVAHLHLMDAESYTLESRKYPQLNNPEHGFYKMEEMSDIIAFGQAIGIDCLPEIEMPAHTQPRMIEHFPFLLCETETVETSKWTMCIGNEKFYEFFADIIAEVANVFPYEILHIGTDEFSNFCHEERRHWPRWYDCKHCKALAKKLGIYQTPAEEVQKYEEDGTLMERGIAGIQEMFMHMVKRMHEIVTKAGKRMMMWNENIDISKPCDLPKDILIHFWRVAMARRGPVYGCSMEAFLEQGFDVINSHYPQTYIEEDIYYPEVPLNTWSPKTYPETRDELKDKILGGWPSAWSNYPHFAYTLPSAIAFYADRLWDESVGYYGKDFCISATRLVLGPHTPEKFNVYAALGGYILPRSTPKQETLYGYVNKVKIPAQEVLETEKTLRTLAKGDGIECELAGIYADCVKWVYEKMTSKE